MIKVRCTYCGKEYWSEDYIDEDERYCSPECRYEDETGCSGEEY